MAQSIGSTSITHHGIGHSHNTAQNINQSTNHTNPMQHPNSLHTNLTHNHSAHPSSTSYNNHHRKSSNDNDEEAIARKKKNADAQAAFRQRRQTYIKSLEDTVTELKSAVTEMEIIVKTTSQEVKIQKQHVEHLEFKLAAYDSGELKPGAFESNQHCQCCKFAPPDLNSRLPSPNNATHHQPRPISTPTTSAITINTAAADCPTPGPSIVTPTITHENMTRDWPSRQGVPSMFPHDSHSRSTHHNSAQGSPHDAPHPSTSLDFPRNILHHPHHPNATIPNSSYPRAGCDLALFTSFGPSESPPITNFYSQTEANHGPTQAPNSLGTAYTPLGHPQSFDAHHSGTLSSPRMWSHNNHTNPSTYAGAEPNSNSNLDGSPKPGLYPIDGSLADVDSSGFRLHRGINERTLMRPTEYIPSLEVRPIPQSYPVVSTLTSPRADSHFAVAGPKTRSSTQNKRRWNDERFGPNQETHDLDDAPNPGKAGVKLNGIPAKVARCEQVCTEVSKVVSQMKEEAKAVTTTKPSTNPSTSHQSVSPNTTSSTSFPSPHHSSHNSLKPQRAKFHGHPPQLTSSTATPAGSQIQPHEEPQPEQDDRRYQSMISN